MQVVTALNTTCKDKDVVPKKLNDRLDNANQSLEDKLSRAKGFIADGRAPKNAPKILVGLSSRKGEMSHHPRHHHHHHHHHHMYF